MATIIYMSEQLDTFQVTALWPRELYWDSFVHNTVRYNTILCNLWRQQKDYVSHTTGTSVYKLNYQI